MSKKSKFTYFTVKVELPSEIGVLEMRDYIDKMIKANSASAFPSGPLTETAIHVAHQRKAEKTSLVERLLGKWN